MRSRPSVKEEPPKASRRKLVARQRYRRRRPQAMPASPNDAVTSPLSLPRTRRQAGRDQLVGRFKRNLQHRRQRRQKKRMRPAAYRVRAPRLPRRSLSPPYRPLLRRRWHRHRAWARSRQGPTAIEEVRLATDFLSRARLADARLVVADKPPALSDFTAVWRSEDAAGAVKIIPPGPDVSAIGIASNLIAVDPQVCKGDFTAARFRSNIGKSVSVHRRIVVQRRQPAARHRVLYHAAASRRVCRLRGYPQQIGRRSARFRSGNIDILSRAAIEAAAHEG